VALLLRAANLTLASRACILSGPGSPHGGLPPCGLPRCGECSRRWQALCREEALIPGLAHVAPIDDCSVLLLANFSEWIGFLSCGPGRCSLC
jgi:hypothetical protein